MLGESPVGTGRAGKGKLSLRNERLFATALMGAGANEGRRVTESIRDTDSTSVGDKQ